MIAHELINHMIPPLKKSDKVGKAMAWMEELRLKELPVVEKGVFLGILSEEEILNGSSLERLVEEYELEADKAVIHNQAHLYEVLRLATDQEVALVAVYDQNESYEGVISIQDTITAFAQSAAVHLKGGIVLLSMNYRDYALSEISRLVESENAKILSSCIKEDERDAAKIKLTLKIDQEDISRVVATLERFGYKIIGRFQETEYLNDDKDKVDLLLKYLNI